jgi:hypothetical protein
VHRIFFSLKWYTEWFWVLWWHYKLNSNKSTQWPWSGKCILTAILTNRGKTSVPASISRPKAITVGDSRCSTPHEHSETCLFWPLMVPFKPCQPKQVANIQKIVLTFYVFVYVVTTYLAVLYSVTFATLLTYAKKFILCVTCGCSAGNQWLWS